jgi:phage shock protein A
MTDKEQEPPVLEGEIVETTPTIAPPVFDYTDGGVPTLDYVRDRIENKFATSVGATELANESPAGVSIDEQMAERDKAGRDKLEEIRRAMRGE